MSQSNPPTCGQAIAESPPCKKDEARQERLSNALRANLMRRKRKALPEKK